MDPLFWSRRWDLNWRPAHCEGARRQTNGLGFSSGIALAAEMPTRNLIRLLLGLRGIIP